MRNIDERMAEISRRSQAIMKARRQRRKRILMACIPVVLCAGLSAVLFLPGAVPESVNEAGKENTAPAAWAESIACSASKIEVSGPDGSKTYTDPAEVLQIWDRINEMTYHYATTSNSVTDSDTAESQEELKTESVTSDYAADDAAMNVTAPAHTIIITMHDGDPREYILTGTALESKTTGRTYTLTREQLKELKELLGIS